MACPSSPRHRTVRRLRLARLALLTAALAAGCGRPPAAEIELAEGTPVILVSIDTLRADRLPAYGYEGVATPAIDRLEKEAVLFEQAYSHTPLTLPSHVSMLAGELPSVHGVRDNVGYRWDAGGRFYLPAALEAAGYRTAATVSSAALRRATGLAAGFELYDDAVDVEPGREVAGAERPGPRTLEAARAWLRSVGDEPFFLFFHLYEPHAPYSPPEPFASRYPSSYDGEVAAADRFVGELFDELRRLDAWDRSLVILVSDHGEGLGDHGEQGHGLFVYREALHVPLLVKLPGGRLGGRRVAAPAQLVDLVPTVAPLLGLETPAGLPGRSLLELEDGDAAERVIYAETYFPRIHFGWSPLLSAIRFPYHLIHGPDPELYHLGRDPGETRNLVQEERRVYAALSREVARFQTELEAPAEEDPEVRRQLEALGYVGRTAPAAEEGPLPDPKTRLHVLARLEEAHELYRRGDLDAAVSAFRAVLVEEPRLLDAWETLGNALLGLGRREAAIETFRKLLEISDGSAEGAFLLAHALAESGRLEEAAGYAEAAAASVPAARHLLARIALERGDLDAAERHLAEARAGLGERPDLLLTAAEIAQRRSRPEEALELTRQARERSGPRPPRNLHRIRGEALASTGRASEARAELRREIELFPDHLEAYSQLALLAALEQDSAGAGRALQQMVETNPTPAAYAHAVRTLEVLGDPDAARRLLARARHLWPESPELRRDGPGG